MTVVRSIRTLKVQIHKWRKRVKLAWSMVLKSEWWLL